jgi:hypothetical protein
MIVLALLTLACGPSPLPSDGTSVPDTAASDSARIDDGVVTFYEDIRPAMDRACARCHQDGSQSFSFEDPATVVAESTVIARETAARTRPPPVADATCNDYVGSEWALTDADIAMFAEWAATGAPLGDPAAAPPRYEPPTIAPYDLELRMPQAYTPTVDNRFRCFVLPLGNTGPVYLRGAEVRVSNERIAHHATLYLLDPTDPVGNTNDPSGYDCAALGDPAWDLLTGWMPGAQGLRFPAGAGLRVETGARMMLTLHYRQRPDDAEASDQTTVGLLLADSAEREVTRVSAGPTGFTIPAGDPSYEATRSTTWNGGDAEVVGVMTRMNFLSSTMGVQVGGACLARYLDFDFHSPYPILLREPMPISNGDTIDVSCVWDNSSESRYQMYNPPQDIRDGVDFDDETCKASVYVVQGRGAPRPRR